MDVNDHSTATSPQSPFMTPRKPTTSDTMTLVPPEGPRKRRHYDTCFEGRFLPKKTSHSPLFPTNNPSYETPKLHLRPRTSSLSPNGGCEHDCGAWRCNVDKMKSILVSAGSQVNPVKLFEEIISKQNLAADDNLNTRKIPRAVSWSEESELIRFPLDELCTPVPKRFRHSHLPSRSIRLQPRKSQGLPHNPLPDSCFLPF